MTTQEYTIDPVKGVDIPVQMPALAPGADPNANVSIKLTPIVKMSNSFISNTYLNIKGGLSFRPVYLDGSSSFGSFNCEPVDLQVGADVPVPVYTTSFEIPFDAKTGDAFYVTTQAPPLAGLLSVNQFPAVLQRKRNFRRWQRRQRVSIDADGGPNHFKPQYVCRHLVRHSQQRFQRRHRADV